MVVECWHGMVLLKLHEDMQKLLVKNAAHSLMGLILISTRCYHWLPAEQCFTCIQSLRLRDRTGWYQRPLSSHCRNRSFWLIWKIHNTLMLITPHKTNRYLSPDPEDCCNFFTNVMYLSAEATALWHFSHVNTYKIIFSLNFFKQGLNFQAIHSQEHHSITSCGVFGCPAGSLLPGDKSSTHWFLPWNSNATFPVFTLWAKMFSVKKWEGSKAL